VTEFNPLRLGVSFRLQRPVGSSVTFDWELICRTSASANIDGKSKEERGCRSRKTVLPASMD
jgi:hypothetical protein